MEVTIFHFYFKCFLTSLVFIIATTRRSKRSKLNLPPGPWKLPVIGNLHQLVGALPHRRLRDLARKHGPLMHLQLGELSHIVVSSADVAREMLRTHDANFSQRPGSLFATFYNFKNIIFLPYGDHWRQMRRICVQELMSPARVRSFHPIREEEISAMVKHLCSASGTPVNITEKIFSMFYSFTGKVVFGKRCRDQEAFISSVNEGMKLTGGLSASELFPSQHWLQHFTGVWPMLEKHLKRIDRILEDIIQDGRENRTILKPEDSSNGQSFLDFLLDIEEKGDPAIPMATQNFRAVVMDMFIGGSDGSSSTLEWAMFELSRNPTVMEKAQAEVRLVLGEDGKIDETRLNEMKYLNSVINETLRMHPPAPLLPRESKESCVMGGYDIPAKTKVIVNAWAIGRDPKCWSDPDKFYPERFIDSKIDSKGTDFQLIPFGAGRRMCPGMSFSMPNIEFFLANMLFHFNWKLPDGIDARKDDEAIESLGMMVRLREDLYLIPVPHIALKN